MDELRKRNVNFIYLHVLKVLVKTFMTRTTQNSIKWTCNEIRDLLISKNKDYGDSALHPDNIFSKLETGVG